MLMVSCKGEPKLGQREQQVLRGVFKDEKREKAAKMTASCLELASMTVGARRLAGGVMRIEQGMNTVDVKYAVYRKL